MSTTGSWKGVPDEKIARYVWGRFVDLDNTILTLGQSLDAARELLEELIRDKDAIKNALRDGVYQLDLKL